LELISKFYSDAWSNEINAISILSSTIRLKPKLPIPFTALSSRAIAIVIIPGKKFLGMDGVWFHFSDEPQASTSIRAMMRYLDGVGTLYKKLSL
jgi:hypothetical protein